MGRVTVRRKITAVDSAGDAPGGLPATVTRIDTLVVEEPLELRVGGRPLAVTMRTPGDDIDLVHGFLATEGVIRGREDVSVARYCAGAVLDDESGVPQNTYNVIDVTLAPHVAPPSATVERNFYTTSSCGVCGKASIDAIRTQAAWEIASDPVRVSAAMISSLPDKLRAEQAAFDRTGGLHAAGLFASDGSVLCVREDVGRHNAVDKIVGWALREGHLPLRGSVLMVSGRASFELVQKATMAGIPVLAAVSAPSSLAVELAEDAGMTLAGFVRGTRMNLYSRADRVES